MACDSGGMGEARPRETPPRDAQAAAAPHMRVLEQPRGELLLDAPVRERRGAVVPGAAARYAPAQLGAVALLRRRALDDDDHRGVAEKLSLGRTTEVGSFSKEVLGRICNGSAAPTPTIQEQEISRNLLRLASRVHGPVECARLQLTQTLAAQTHSARAQVGWRPDNSTEHLMSYVQDSVRPLAERTGETWEEAYIGGVETVSRLCKANMLGVTITANHSYRTLQAGDTNVTNMLLMGNIDVNEVDPEQYTENYSYHSVSSSTEEPRIVWLQLKNDTENFQGNICNLTPVHSAAAKCSYRALQDCFPGKNGSMRCVKPLLYFGANTNLKNLHGKHGPILMAAVQDMCFNINSEIMIPWDSSLQKNQGLKEDTCDRLLNNELDDSKESCTGLKTACHCHFVSSSSAQVAKINSQRAPKLQRSTALSSRNGSAPEPPLLSQPKRGPLPEPVSFQIVELAESDLQPPTSSLDASVSVDPPQDIDRPQLDVCSNSNQIQQNDKCSRSNTRYTGDACRTRCQKVPIFIAHCSGEVVLTVNLDESSQHMMHLFEEKTRMKLRYHYFKYGNKGIDPNCTLLSYGIGRDAKVDACSRLLGGMSATLEDYFQDNKGKLVSEVTLPDDNVSLDITEECCRIFSTWLSCFTWAFSKGKSWNGLFSLKDFILVEGHVRIGTNEPKIYGLGSMEKDITKFISHVKTFLYRKKEKKMISEYPPFFRILTVFMGQLSMMKTISKEDRLFLETHVSCTTSFNWGQLIIKLHRRYKGLHSVERTKWDDAIKAAHCPAKWYTDLSRKTVFKDFVMQAREIGITYDNSKVSAFYLMRDMVMHGLDHKYIVKLPNYDKLNLMISAHLEDFLPSIIENLIKEKVDIREELLEAKVHCFCQTCNSSCSET